MRRLAFEYEEIKRVFAGHRNIIVTPIGDEPPEKYHVTYFVNGIYLPPDGRIETLGRHEVEIELHADYPRYKPICKILTPIWHPNFKDGQICIGDIWGAGESLSDIIINIGDMIQYKSWNSFSPLSADAAKWAIENKHLFPVGNIDLYPADYTLAKDEVEIDLFTEDENKTEEPAAPPVQDSGALATETAPVPDGSVSVVKENENDFEITAEELAGIEFVPTAQRMHTVAHGGFVKGKINLKTILIKGLLWALIGALIGFGSTELADISRSESEFTSLLGYSYLSEFFHYREKAYDTLKKVYAEFKAYCKEEGLDPELSGAFEKWYSGSNISSEAKELFDDAVYYWGKADDNYYDSYRYEFDQDTTSLLKWTQIVSRLSSGLWAAIIALFIGLCLGAGEGIFYGSKGKAVKYGSLGAGMSIIIGFLSGYFVQWLYSALLGDDPFEIPLFLSSVIRGAGWAVMGLGAGLAIGLIRPGRKRILFCGLGGLTGAFIGGFLFNYIYEVIPNGTVARAIGITLMGGLIGIGVGLLEQFAKQAWLKVIRGEFEGKEYLVFAGTTSIGNSGKNTIVLFKDKLVGPHHCDIILEGGRYILVDCGTPMGTIVNGIKKNRHVLRRGDAIAIGNSVLVFYTK